MFGEPRCGKSSPVGKTEQRSESICGSQPHEVEIRYRRLKVGRQHRSLFDTSDSAEDLGMEEGEPSQVGFVTCSRDHMICVDGFSATVVVSQLQTHAAVLHAGSSYGNAEIEAHLTDNLILRKPARCGTENAADLVEAKLYGHLSEHQGKIRTQEQLPARANPGDRRAETIDQRRVEIIRRIVEADLGHARNDLNRRP